MTAYIFSFDSVFWISLSSMIIAAFGLGLKYCLRSRCDNINLCYGLVQVHRNVELEDREINIPIDNNFNQNENKNENENENNNLNNI